MRIYPDALLIRFYFDPFELEQVAVMLPSQEMLVGKFFDRDDPDKQSLDEIYAGTYVRAGADDIFMLTPPLLTVKNANDFNVDE